MSAPLPPGSEQAHLAAQFAADALVECSQQSVDSPQKPTAGSEAAIATILENQAVMEQELREMRAEQSSLIARIGQLIELVQAPGPTQPPSAPRAERAAAQPRNNPGSTSSASDKSTANSWESQKAKLLQLCEGIDELPATGSVDEPGFGSDDLADASSSEYESSPEPVVSAAVAETEADLLVSDEQVEQLRKRWEQKLRQAEIEISIERAKVGRMQAELESKLTELNQRLRGLDEMGSSDRKSSKAMSRFARFLPHRKTRDDHGSSE